MADLRSRTPLSELPALQHIREWDNRAMLLVAQVAAGIVLSFLLFRSLPLIIRLGALVLLAVVMVFLWLVSLPVIVPIRCIRRLTVRGAAKHSSDVASSALDQPDRRIPHRG